MTHTVTRYSFTVRDIPGTWHVRKVDLHESLSQPYSLAVELITPDLDLDPRTLLGAACALTIAHSPGPTRDVHGLVLRLETLDHDAHRRHIRLEIGPALALLAHRVDTRLWQHTSVPDIVRDVLEDSLTAHGRRLRLDLAASYPARETCTQYRESDLEFVQRILDEEGISFSFDHDDDAEILVLVDDTSRCPVLGELPFIPRGAHLAEAESIERLDPARSLGVTSLTQRDWSPLAAADSPFEHNRLAHDDRGRQRLVYEHDDRRIDRDDTPVRTRRKLEQRTQLATAATGHSTALGFSPGRRFDLGGHPDPSRDQRWLLLHVEHHGDIPDADRRAANTTTDEYLNRFTCVPDTTPLRPPFNPTLHRPRIHGPHTAIVVGPEGEEIHTDEHGRIRVRFHWDRSLRRGDDCSCWIRVAQTWSGPGWGGLFIPRVGMEVLVEFLDGDPDRPLVTGCVYNSLHRPPVALPDHKTRSGLTSESTPGGGLANQIWLEDARGRESLTLHTRRDLHTHAGHDHTADIKNDADIDIGQNLTTTVGANHITTVQDHCNLTVSEGDLTTIVGSGNRSAHIRCNDTTTVDGHTLHKNTTGDHHITAQRDIALQTYQGALDLQGFDKVQLTSVSSAMAITAKKDVDVSSTAGALGLIAETDTMVGASKGTIDLLAGTHIHARAGNGDVRLSAGHNATLKSSEKTSVLGPTIRLQAEVAIELHVGGTYLKLTPSGIELHAPHIESRADSDHNIIGGIIRLN